MSDMRQQRQTYRYARKHRERPKHPPYPTMSDSHQTPQLSCLCGLCVFVVVWCGLSGLTGGVPRRGPTIHILILGVDFCRVTSSLVCVDSNVTRRRGDRGQLSVVLDRGLLEEVRRVAGLRGLSLVGFVEWALEVAVRDDVGVG